MDAMMMWNRWRQASLLFWGLGVLIVPAKIMVRTEHFHVATYETTRLYSGWRENMLGDNVAKHIWRGRHHEVTE